MNKTRRIALYIYLVLAGIGLQFELGDMAEKDVTLEAGRDLVLNLAVLAAFFLPFYFLIKKLAKKLSVEMIVLATALFGGAFISGWLSFAGNSLIDIINSNFIKDPAVFNDWTNALTAPFAEEFFKSLTAFAALHFGTQGYSVCLNRWTEFGFWLSSHRGYWLCIQSDFRRTI